MVIDQDLTKIIDEYFENNILTTKSCEHLKTTKNYLNIFIGLNKGENKIQIH